MQKTSVHGEGRTKKRKNALQGGRKQGKGHPTARLQKEGNTPQSERPKAFINGDGKMGAWGGC